MRAGTLGDFLAEAGAVVGGTAALGATVGFVGASLVREVRPDVDPDAWARVGGFWRGAFGLLVFLEGA